MLGRSDFRVVATKVVAVFLIVGYLSIQMSGQTECRIIPRTGKVPRIADGRPNLEGVWAYGTVTPLERLAQFAGKRFMNDTEAEQFLTESAANKRAQQAAQLGVPEFVEPIGLS
jgi:hypothetical protein